MKAPWHTARARGLARELDQVDQLIDTLTADPDTTSTRDGGPHDAVITVPWTSAAHARQLFTARALPIGAENRYTLTGWRAPHWRIRLETTVPAATLARHAADAVVHVNAQLISGTAETDLDGHACLRDAVRDVLTAADAAGAIHRAPLTRPFGDDGTDREADGTLAVLLLDASGLTTPELTSDLLPGAALALSQALRHAHDLLDVADTLDRGRITLPTRRTPDGRRRS